MNLKALVLGVGVAAAGTASAAEYGPAGCGLGSVLLGNKPGIIQVFAATTNGISANQTFGILFGTLNCGASELGRVSTKAYIETNREALVKDMARGSGETLRNLATVAGCSSPDAVGVRLQSNFQSIVPASGANGLADRVIESLQSDASLSCGHLG
jgi:hypothetical protein